MKLLFDCDGTILDSMHIWTKPLNELLQKYNYELSKKEKSSIESLDYTAMCEWLCQNIVKDKTPDQIKEYFNEIINDGYNYSLMPKIGAKELLKNLKNEGFEMAIASSTDINLLEKALKRLDLLNCFEFIITPDTCPYNKGEKEFWELATYKLNEKNENVILFDDALYAIKVAKSVGIKTCAIKDFPYNQNDWTNLQKEADMFLDNIKDIDLRLLK